MDSMAKDELECNRPIGITVGTAYIPAGAAFSPVPHRGTCPLRRFQKESQAKDKWGLTTIPKMQHAYQEPAHAKMPLVETGGKLLV